MSYSQPLTLYVVWHPDFAAGIKIATELFKFFCRDADQPYGRGIGLPVFFRSLPAMDATDGLPLLPDLGGEGQVLVLVLLESKMMLSKPWKVYLQRLADAIPPSGVQHTLLFTKVYDKPLQLPASWNSRNLIQLGMRKDLPVEQSAEALGKAVEGLQFIVATEACRMLMVKAGVHDKKPTLKVFLSHARRDGAENAKELNVLFNNVKYISTFLDILSIDFGSDFRAEIEQGVTESILLVWLTDAYSTRDWCKREFLLAKQHRRPIMVVNGLSTQEARSFPYAGNAPSIRWSDNPHEVLKMAVMEALRHFYNERYLEEISESYQNLNGLSGETTHTLPNAPELLSFRFLHAKGAIQTILYPDPPLSPPELEVLQMVAADMRLVTPAWILAQYDKAGHHGVLVGKKIALSLSRPDPHQLLSLGFSDAHLNDTLIEFFRYIFSGGGHVIYGCNLRKEGYAFALIALAREYASDTLDDAPFSDYLSWPFLNDLDEDLQAELQGIVSFEPIVRHAAFGEDRNPPFDESNVLHQFATAIAGSEMRINMATQENVRILIGGKLDGYFGFVPGVLEEAYNTIRAGKPCYVLGAWGGVAGAICKMLTTGVIPTVFQDGHVQSHSRQKEIWAMRKDWEDKIDFLRTLPSSEEMARFILEKGIAGLNNGLTDAENMELFLAKHVPEMVSLVMKGLAAKMRA